MDRLSRYINNQKQDKIQAVRSQPSVSAMREGEEVLYQGKNKPLRRYRKQNGILWYSDMTRDGNEYVDKNLTVKNNATINSNLTVDGTATISGATTISGAATVSGNINANGNIDGDGSTNITDINQLEVSEIYGYNGDTNTKITFTTDQIDFYAGNEKILTLDEAGSDVAVINADQEDINFRVAASGIASAFFVEGSSGIIGIGTNAPDSNADVHISGGTNGWLFIDGTQDSGLQILDSGTMRWKIFNSTGTGPDRLYIRDEEGDTGVYIAQDATSWTADSDENLKTDISSISDALSKVNSIRGVNFKWKKYKPDGDDPNPDRDRNRIGCIAQEVNEVLPEAVDTAKDGEWGISYTTLIPLLIEAVKELSAEVEKLKG